MLQRLQAQDETQPVLDVFERLASDPARWFRKDVPVECNHLRNVGDRVFRQPRGPGRKEDIAGGLQQPQVGRENDGDDGSNSASVEGVVLHDQKRPPKARFGPAGLVEDRPTTPVRARLPCVGFKRAALGASNRRFDTSRFGGVHGIESFGSLTPAVSGHVVGQGSCVQAASGHAKPLAQRLCGLEELVWYREGYFHTRVLPR